ncbi:hypothetical protein GCM10027174_05760 [Salinifilum aidingensis]
MKPGCWFTIAGIAGVFALILGLTTAFSTGLSPRSYVQHNYARAERMDPPGRNSRAYTSPQPPTQVAADISDHWRPQNRYADGSGIYLRYPDDAIVVKPRGRGSRIDVMDARRAYHHYYGIIGGAWGWNSTYGESFRGRGPGVGK